jgi:hypothetical protein
MDKTVWVQGLCDRIFMKIVWWMKYYHQGKPAAVVGRNPTLQALAAGEGKTTTVVTARAVNVAWRKEELEYLIAILKDRRPSGPFADLGPLMEKDLPRWINGKPCVGNQRLITMAMRPADLEEIYLVMLELKLGKVKETKSIADVSFAPPNK